MSHRLPPALEELHRNGHGYLREEAGKVLVAGKFLWEVRKMQNGAGGNNILGVFAALYFEAMLLGF